MNSKNSKTSDLHRILLNLTDRINLKRSDKYNIHIHGKILKSLYKNNKFKISVPTWNEEFELLDGSCSLSDIHDYFEYVLKTRRKIC